MPGYLVGQLLGIPAYKDKTTTLVVSAQDTLYKAILVLLTVTAIIWMSIFLYATFYYSYMPAISHARPVHLQFSRTCDRGKDEGMCSFPTANVVLTKRQQLLMVGQPYRVMMELEMPESLANQQLGMFMVCVDLKDKEGELIADACRAAMLHYKSYLHHLLSTLFFSPFLLSGSTEEKQIVQIELFTSFEEDPNRPITEATVQIQSNYIEIYQTSLKIHAHFTGLRYLMFHWPVLSALVGITTNLFFLSVIAFLSWFKFFSPKQVSYPVGYDSSAAKSLEDRRALAKHRLMKERGKLLNQRVVIPGEAATVVATKKDDLDSTVASMQPKPVPVIVTAPSGKVLGEQNENKVKNESGSDTLITGEEKIGSGRRSSDEFVVLSDGKESPELRVKEGYEQECDSSSLGSDFRIEGEDSILGKEDDLQEENLEEDKENKVNVDKEDETSSSDEQQSTLRRRDSLSRRTGANI